MAFAQALLEGVVQVAAADAFLAIFQESIHYRIVDFDHLVDDARVRLGD